MLFHFLGSPELWRLTATHLNCMLYLLRADSVCVLEEIIIKQIKIFRVMGALKCSES